MPESVLSSRLGVQADTGQGVYTHTFTNNMLAHTYRTTTALQGKFRRQHAPSKGKALQGKFREDIAQIPGMTRLTM